MTDQTCDKEIQSGHFLGKTLLLLEFDFLTTLSGGFLVTNRLAREQQMLRDVGFSVFCRFNSKPT